MQNQLISVIIPSYNEEKIVANSIDLVEKCMLSLKRPFEIVIVNDASTDRTLEIIESKRNNKPYMRVISYKDGPSRRENLNKSFKFLKGEYIILLDMDLAMDLKHVKDFVYWLDKGYDMVIPNRYHKNSKIQRNPIRYIISKLYNFMVRILFRTKFKDNICGFKSFKREAALRILKEAGTDETRTRSVFWDTELIIHAIHDGMRIKEIPIKWKEGKNSALTFKREIKMLPYIIKFWINIHKNK